MSTYSTDFHRWIEEQAALIKASQWSRVDADHLVEELESMGARERRELISRLAVLLTHLLEWQYQPERRSISWRLTINEQRRQIALILDDSPSLRNPLENFLLRAYGNATRAALEQTGFLVSPFPATCPYSIPAILDESFWPD
jgi:hypothetical protein